MCHGVRTSNSSLSHRDFNIKYEITLSNIKIIGSTETSENGNPNGDVNSPYTTIPVLMYIGTN